MADNVEAVTFVLCPGTAHASQKVFVMFGIILPLCVTLSSLGASWAAGRTFESYVMPTFVVTSVACCLLWKERLGAPIPAMFCIAGDAKELSAAGTSRPLRKWAYIDWVAWTMTSPYGLIGCIFLVSILGAFLMVGNLWISGSKDKDNGSQVDPPEPDLMSDLAFYLGWYAVACVLGYCFRHKLFALGRWFGAEIFFDEEARSLLKRAQKHVERERAGAGAGATSDRGSHLTIERGKDCTARTFDRLRDGVGSVSAFVFDPPLS